MNRKRVKLLKSLIAIVTAISINACCVMQAYALPEPSPDWWQAATVIVGGAAANGTVVISAPVIIGTAVVALGLCAGAWAVTHPAEFNGIVSDVKSRISSLLVGKDNSGMMVKVEDGVPYLDEDTLTQIAQALHDGGYLSGSANMQPEISDGPLNGTYLIESSASLEEVFDFICRFYASSSWHLNVWYNNNTLNDIYNRAPSLAQTRLIILAEMIGEYVKIAVNLWRGPGGMFPFPYSSHNDRLFRINMDKTSDNYGLLQPYGYTDGGPWNSFGLVTEDLEEPNGKFTSANWSSSDDYGITENAVQVDGDNVTIPEWAGDIKESIDDLGNSIKNYPISLPSGTAIPYIFPNNTPEADIKTMVQDVPIPEEKPIPEIAEEGRTQEEVQNPDPDKPIETLPEEPLTESTLPSLKLPAALAQRFPFSLVSDINVLISKLSGTGEAPHFSIPVKIDIANIDTSIDVDLSMFSGAVSVVRPVILACAVFGIIRLTFKVINV